MKRAFLAAICAFSLASGAFAQTALAGLSPKDARSMGMGGSFRVFASGYQTFFGNPVGFAGPGSLTLADVAAWGYFNPTPANIGDLAAIAQGETSTDEAEVELGDLIAENGFGGGASVGLGWSGKGFGLGLTLISDALATGTTYDDAATTVMNQANAVLGVAWPLPLGAFTFKFGADVRAFYRLDSAGTWLFADLASAFLSGQGYTDEIAALAVKGGYGVAVDTGATLGIGPLTAGVMVRDYGYKFYMGDATVGDIVDAIDLPMNEGTAYSLIPVYAVGLALNFKSDKPLASSFYLEVDDPVGYIEAAKENLTDSFGLLHAGAELKILNFIALRAGFNEGLLALGAGIDLALIEVDAAFFSEKISGAADGPGRSGVSVQAAVRF